MPPTAIRHASEMSTDPIQSCRRRRETPLECVCSPTSSAASASASPFRCSAALVTLIRSIGVSASKSSGNSGSVFSSRISISSKTARAAGLIPATASSSSSRINALRCILLSPVCAIDASKKVGITFQLLFSSTAVYLIALCVQNIAGFEKDNFIERPLRDYLRLFNFIHDLKDDLIRHG